MRKYVNRSLFLATLGILLGFSSTSAFAQIATKVAYLNKNRDKIYVTKGDGQSEVLFPTNPAIKVTSLTLLGSTSDGKSIVVAGNFDVNFGSKSIAGPAIVRIDSPYVIDITHLNSFEVLLALPGDAEVKADPIGAISRDNQQWYATWQGSSDGGVVPLKLYHGRVYPTPNDKVDSSQDDDVNKTFFQTEGEFHMSNIAISSDGNQMVAVTVDHLGDGSDNQRYTSHVWKPKAFYTPWKDWQPAVKAQYKYDNTDSAMGYVVTILPGDKEYTMAFVTQENNLEFRKFRLDNKPVFNGSSETGITIPRSILPDSLLWFRGREDQVLPPHALTLGTGSDIAVSRDQGKFLVTVHEANPDELSNRNKFSQIWEINVAGGTATQMVNDPSIAERNPQYFYYDQHTPVAIDSGYLSIGVSSLDFGTADTGKTVTKQITVTNPSGRAVTLNSATVTGAGFSIVSNSKGVNPPFTVGVEESVNFNIAFKPTTGGNATGTFTVKFASSNDSTRTASLTGVGNIPVDGVRLPNAAEINLTVSPNPFKQSTLITLTAQETGNTTFEVTDVMGRVVFSAPVVKLAKGESRSFEFNAQQLNVPAGIYHVSAVSAGQTLTRQIVYVK